MLRLRKIVFVAGSLASALAGCGGADENGAVQNTVKTYLSAFADGNGQKACDQLTGQETRTIVQGAVERLPELQSATCPDALSKLSGSLGADEKQTLRDAKITNVHVTGDSATAEVVGGTQTADLTKAHGRWLISGGLTLGS